MPKVLEAVTILVEGQEIALQVPCPNCQGGTLSVYDPTVPRTCVGRCQDCQDGYVDTPFFTAIKRHLGIPNELNGAWMGKLSGPFVLSDRIQEIADSIYALSPLHFYPDDWRMGNQYKRALCCQGRRDEVRITKARENQTDLQYCGNCLRIKRAIEFRR